ncbi:ComEA family DNA-binding protein [Ruminococcus sp. OA3]|uniref:ComEA family DNA-binding protein n=1 Tax=Ruminococcus sp. OA3 TaxID=2914164 RepID=UPI001F06051A|nr:ComEA family DNA-binding protein [Ruminococcus sp. OA3]MCH1982129.1 ComEA family DNA-binding protein [Ruminococcus sp. OA3]
MEKLWRKSKRKLILCLVCMMILGGCRKETVYELDETPEKETDSEGPAADEKENICIYICGAVAVPGVYELEAGSRVIHAVEAAGGLTEEACAGNLNQARQLSDGEQINVLTLAEAEAAVQAGDGDTQGQTDGKININTADAAKLMELTGIGAAKAEAILAYREAHGGFQDTEELKKVDGIADKTFEKIKESITVN